MTVPTTDSFPARSRFRAVWILARVRQSVAARHSAGLEIAGLVVLYAVYEVIRGLRHAPRSLAVGHARDIVTLERALHLFAEGRLQQALGHVPALLTVLAFAYPILYGLGTLGVLVWAYRSRPAHYPRVRMALVAATGLALVIYVVFPVAPPRLTGLGITDTVSDRTPLDLSSPMLRRLYNPVAAVPSLHFAYALLTGTVLVVLARQPAPRVAGVLLPVMTLVVISATGNHFFTDAAAGAVVAAIGFGIAVATCPLAGDEPRRARRYVNPSGSTSG